MWWLWNVLFLTSGEKMERWGEAFLLQETNKFCFESILKYFPTFNWNLPWPSLFYKLINNSETVVLNTGQFHNNFLSGNKVGLAYWAVHAVGSHLFLKPNGINWTVSSRVLLGSLCAIKLALFLFPITDDRTDSKTVKKKIQKAIMF